jgi:hypothetical protein
VILVHGRSGDALRYFGVLQGSKCAAERLAFVPNATRENVLIAPHIPDDDDEDDADPLPPPNYHYWPKERWPGGSHSVGSSGTISSFTVMDVLISRLVGGRLSPSPFPNLEMIVVAGFSAGGQYVHRYAATNNREGNLGGIRMRYVVGSPSSYLYLDNRRPYYDGFGGFGVPYRCAGFPYACYNNYGFLTAPRCPSSYNEWRYGLEDLNTYAGAVGVDVIRDRLVRRDVIVLVGTDDDESDVEYLDTSCSARLQGRHRYDRARKLVDYMDARFPGHNHWFLEVAGADHDAWEVFAAPPGYGEVGPLTLFVDF